MKRLLPALATMIVVVSTLVSLFDPDPRRTLLTGLSALFGLSNMAMVWTSTDYFAPATEFNAFLHTWSLGVEEQYYVVYPLLFWYLLRPNDAGTSARGLRGLGVLALLSLALFIWLSGREEMLAFYFMPARFWELAVGCLLYFATSRRAPTFLRSKGLAEGCSAILVLTLFLPEEMSVVSTPVCVAATAGVIATARWSTLARSVLTSPPMVWTGLMSYSLYLWHWPVVSLSHLTIGISAKTLPLQLALVVALSAASYFLIERPLRSASWAARPAGSMGWGGTAAVACAGVVYGLSIPANGSLFVGDTTPATAYAPSAWLLPHSELVEKARQVAASCNMTPHHLTGADYAPKPVVDDIFLDRCLASSSTGPRLILVGDSFANVSVPHLTVVAERLGRDLGVLFGYGCTFPLRLEQIVHAVRTVCHEVDDAWLRDEIVERLRAGDILVVRLHLSNPEYLDYSEITPTAPVSYDDEIEALALDVRSKGARLVVIGDNPRLSVRDLQLLTPQWFNFGNAKDRVDRNNTPETAYFHALDRHL